MLLVETPERELFNEETNEFITVKKESFLIEHSLLSLSKWESKWCKPFLTKKNEKTTEETIDYIRCMTVTPNVAPTVYDHLSDANYAEIEAYIAAPMTATWFSDKQKNPPNPETITSELIYYWMVSLNIPFQCEKWHLTRLLTLIRVCNLKNQPPKKQNKKEMLSSRAALNAARRSQFNTKG